MGLKRGQIEFEIEREEIRRRRFERLHRADMRGQLKQMMGESAEFRGLQEAVIRTVVRGDGPIVQITPTGGGKSLTFMLPAFCTPDGMTIVVTPLVALENDMEERCRKMGIDGYVWKSRGVQRGASLVFVTPESAVTKGFRSFVERMHGQEKLDRVMVDECHTALEWTKTFRPRIGQLGSALQEFGLQVICLTATLKRTEERLLYAQLGFEAERVRLFRERTTRRNIEYRVEIIEDREGEGVGRRSGGQRSAQEGARRWKQNGSAAKNNKGEEEDEVIERVCEVVKTWTEVNHNEGKVVIYGGTIERVKKIAASLDCVGYWNKAGSAEDKARWMEEWRTSVGGKSGWIVATNALGLGVDVPDVRLVVHAGMPRRLRDFVQESGRGGRDGKRSESVVVVQSSWMKEQQEIWTKRREERDRGGDNGVSEEGAVSKQAYEWEEDVVEFVEGKECRREVLDREMDGFMGRVGCEVGEEERCDVCRERALRMEAQVSRRGTSWVSIQSEEEEELARAAAAVEADYERSKRSIQWAEMEQVARVMKEAEDAADFEAELDDWSGRCIVCKVGGSEDEV
jgi:superfamily II DNA helicase RecQ